MSFNASDQHHIDAAEGWIGLRDFREATLELAAIPEELQEHPTVLRLRWEICAAAKDWSRALDIASILVRRTPEDPLGWVHQSYALHELKRTQEARDHLARVVDQYPALAVMPYNLACYECQLGRLAEARKWLRRAFEIADSETMKHSALEDFDLKPLWKEIREL